MNAFTGTVAIAAFVIVGGDANAACQSVPVNIPWNVQDGDQRVSGDFAAKHMVGKKVRFKPTGTENYGVDGSYSYEDTGGTYKANGYRFYEDGSRCLDYENNPRYDLYVVRDGKFWLINAGGGRLPARITN